MLENHNDARIKFHYFYYLIFGECFAFQAYIWEKGHAAISNFKADKQRRGSQGFPLPQAYKQNLLTSETMKFFFVCSWKREKSFENKVIYPNFSPHPEPASSKTREHPARIIALLHPHVEWDSSSLLLYKPNVLWDLKQTPA